MKFTKNTVCIFVIFAVIYNVYSENTRNTNPVKYKKEKFYKQFIGGNALIEIIPQFYERLIISADWSLDMGCSNNAYKRLVISYKSKFQLKKNYVTKITFCMSHYDQFWYFIATKIGDVITSRCIKPNIIEGTTIELREYMNFIILAGKYNLVTVNLKIPKEMQNQWWIEYDGGIMVHRGSSKQKSLNTVIPIQKYLKVERVILHWKFKIIINGIPGNGVIIQRARKAVSVVGLYDELIQLNCYTSIIDVIKLAKDSFNINKAFKTLQNLNFVSNPCKILHYIEKRLRTNHITNIMMALDKSKPPSLYSKLRNGSSTSSDTDLPLEEYKIINDADGLYLSHAGLKPLKGKNFMNILTNPCFFEPSNYEGVTFSNYDVHYTCNKGKLPITLTCFENRLYKYYKNISGETEKTLIDNRYKNCFCPKTHIKQNLLAYSFSSVICPNNTNIILAKINNCFGEELIDKHITLAELLCNNLSACNRELDSIVKSKISIEYTCAPSDGSVKELAIKLNSPFAGVNVEHGKFGILEIIPITLQLENKLKPFYISTGKYVIGYAMTESSNVLITKESFEQRGNFLVINNYIAKFKFYIYKTIKSCRNNFKFPVNNSEDILVEFDSKKSSYRCKYGDDKQKKWKKLYCTKYGVWASYNDLSKKCPEKPFICQHIKKPSIFFSRQDDSRIQSGLLLYSCIFENKEINYTCHGSKWKTHKISKCLSPKPYMSIGIQSVNIFIYTKGFQSTLIALVLISLI
ncbi:hypothetical protein A3Q56_05469 [Intoshia linei]|uniref:Uncharacterized protein n=1 Tax=Intoshia linei TaxID=1819745 RepID=A0A177AXV4_9BILA|nr:hypothetical protein A3Q56_05469 [Intoshia linei]